MKTNQCAVVIALAFSGISGQAISGTNLADARSVGMGGTGVASADFLTSSFHNPALGAVYRDEDDIGILLPGIGAELSDTDDIINTVDDAADVYDNNEDIFENNTSGTDAPAQLSAYLDKLSDKHPVRLSAAAGLAVAIPTRLLSVNLFADGYGDVVAKANIGEKPSDYSDSDVNDVQSRYEDSTVQVAGIVATEIGIGLAHQMSIAGQHIALGLAPKVQKFTSYALKVSVDEFDIDDYDENKRTASAFNMDLGAVWLVDNWRAAIAVKDLIATDIDTAITGMTYQVKPKVTLGGAYTSQFFVATVEGDLTKETRFTGLQDDTQFIRAGIEGNAWGWAQLRAGYAYDLEGNADNTFSAGIGISPFDMVSLDLSANYATTSSLGGSANLAFTF